MARGEHTYGADVPLARDETGVNGSPLKRREQR